MIRVASISSSSRHGNCYLVEGPGPTRILVDCGARRRDLEAGLAELGVAPGTISALLLTHEHSDHTYCLGLRRLPAALGGAPLYAHPDLRASCPLVRGYLGPPGGPAQGDLIPGRRLTVGSLEVVPFATPHDASRPLGFQISADGYRLGLATDLGHVSPEVARHLYGCDALVLESNHDREMQLRSGRPRHLIERVTGDLGHLSNRQAAAALRDLVTGRTVSILLAHLSLDCNLPGLALETSQKALGRSGWRGALRAAPAQGPSGWMGPGAG